MAHKHGGKVPESPPDIRDHVWPLLKKELKVIIRRVQELNLEIKNNQFACRNEKLVQAYQMT